MTAQQISFLRWALDNIEAGEFTLDDVIRAFREVREPAPEPKADLSAFEEIAETAFEKWEGEADA